MSNDIPNVPALLAAPLAPPIPQDFIALSPQEMTTAHGGMLQWAASKVKEMKAEVEEFQAEADLAKANKWRSGGFERHKKVSERRLLFYEKIIEALNAGYIVVPNFAMNAFAIRTKAESPRGKVESARWGTPGVATQEAQQLPVGEGEYVNPTPSRDAWSEQVKNSKGEEITKYFAEPSEFVDVVFPLAVAKPQIMAAAGQAMALKVFDEIGMTEEWNQSRRGDPIVLGRLLNPRRNSPSMTFFIGWYFDARRI